MRRWTAKEWIEPNPEMVKGMEESDSDNLDDILIKDPHLPNTFVSFLPLLLPVVLISMASFANMYAPEGSTIRLVFGTIGHKVVALFIGVVVSIILGFCQRKAVLNAYAVNYPEEKTIKLKDIILNKWIVRALLVCLAPLLITAMGGAFGKILSSAPALQPLSETIGNSPIPAILVPWAVAAIMMAAVGSMTTAGMTAAAVVLPMVPALGLSPWPLSWLSAPAP